MKSATSSFSIQLQEGDLNAITISYYHNKDLAYFNVKWSGPGLIDNSVLSGEYLSYAREIINSPITVEVYPGDVDHITSTASGMNLADCVALESCSFVIQSKDSSGNNIYNNGAVNWNVSIVGVADWAGYDNTISRINDVNQTKVQDVTVSVVPVTNSWVSIGFASVINGGSVITVLGDVTTRIAREDTILVVTETMMVSNTATYNFAGISTTVPLRRPYLGKSNSNFEVFKLSNCSTGKYTVTYTPKVRGYYNINILTQNVNEVQKVEFLTSGGLSGNYTLTVTSVVDGQLIAQTSTVLQLGSTSSSALQIETALKLTLLGTVAVSISQSDTINCIFTVTFMGLNRNANLPLLTVNSMDVNGNDLAILVTEITAGSAAQNIVNSPFTLAVAPAVANAGFTTAFGPGLTFGETGILGNFKVQSKDAYGNNRLGTQVPEVYRVHAYLPQSDRDLTASSVEGQVTYASVDRPVGWVDKSGSSCAVYAGLYDARRGECSSGPNCGCGASDNVNQIGAGSFGLSADQACCACRGDCGGQYNVSYLPTRSGEYTIAVMLGTKLEVQNITADITARTGYFILQFGFCEVGMACVQTKRLAWSTDGAGMQDALQMLPGIGDISVLYTTTSDRNMAAWVVSFNTACDIDPIISTGGTLPVVITQSVAGECSMVSAESVATPYPYVNTLLINEVQDVKVVCTAVYSSFCTFTLSFRGYVTISLSYGASITTVKAALEALATIGTVQVGTTTPVANTITYRVTFTPTMGSTLGHIENYGNLPPIQISSTTLSSSSVTELINGYSPFSASVAAVIVSASNTTAIDQRFTSGDNGLHGGIYLDESSFIIESRDMFTNRVLLGPVKDIQVIEIVGGSPSSLSLTGFITISFEGHSVEVAAQVNK